MISVDARSGVCTVLMNVTLKELLLLLCLSHLSSFSLSPGSLSVSEVARLLQQETLQLLKKECGGLQTLLKNNHQVFRGSWTALFFFNFILSPQESVRENMLFQEQINMLSH